MNGTNVLLSTSPLADPSYGLPRLLRPLPVALCSVLIAAMFYVNPLYIAVAVVSVIMLASTIEVRSSMWMLILLLPLYRTGMGSDVGLGFGVFDIFSLWFIFLYAWKVGLIEFFRLRQHNVIVLGFVMLAGLMPSLINTESQVWYWRGLAQILINLLIMSALYYRLTALDDERFIRTLFHTLCTVTTGFALQGVYMSVRYRAMLGIGGMAGRSYNFLFGDPNYWAGFLLMTLCFSVTMIVLERRRFWRMLEIFNSVIIFIAIILTVSRAGYLATLIIGLFFTVYFWKYAGIKRIIGSAAAFLVLVSGVVLLTTNLGSNLADLLAMSERLTSAVQGKDASVNQRKSIQIVGWRMAWHTPVVGVGFGNFEVAFDRFREAELGTINGEACHNTYLKLFAETGLVGLIIALIFYATLLITLWKSFRAQTDPERRMIMFGLFTGVFSYFLMNATLDQVYEAHFWTMSGAALAYAQIFARRNARGAAPALQTDSVTTEPSRP